MYVISIYNFLQCVTYCDALIACMLIKYHCCCFFLFEMLMSFLEAFSFSFFPSLFLVCNFIVKESIQKVSRENFCQYLFLTLNLPICRQATFNFPISLKFSLNPNYLKRLLPPSHPHQAEAQDGPLPKLPPPPDYGQRIPSHFQAVNPLPGSVPSTNKNLRKRKA